MADRRTLLQHPLFRVEGWAVPRRDGGHTQVVRMCSTPWVNVVPLTEDGHLVLVRQHRYGIEADTLEIPGGVAEAGEDPMAAAARELLEETGYGGGHWEPLGWVWSNPAIMDNRTWMYLARGVRLVGQQDLDPTEDVTVELVPVARLPELLDSGAIAHSLAVVSLQRFLLRSRP